FGKLDLITISTNRNGRRMTSFSVRFSFTYWLTRWIWIDLVIWLTTQLAAIKPTVEGVKALEDGGICALRIAASFLPTVSTTSSRTTMGLSSEKITGTPLRMPACFSFLRIIFANGSVWVFEMSAILKRVGSVLLAAPMLEMIGMRRL